MATIQKTTLKRYNGTDWDPVYLANSADITYLGTGFQVAAGEGFAVGDQVSANETTASLLTKVINALTAVDKVKIPALADGSAVTSVPAAKLTGVIDSANLPEAVYGKAVEVDSEEAKAQLSDVNTGDIVKVTGGKVYVVSGVNPIAYMELTDSASDIAWARVTGAPTTLAGYGITDAVASNEKVTVASAENAGKILVLNADGKLDVSVTGDAATVGGKEVSYFATKEEHDAVAARVTTNEGDITTLKGEMKAIDAAWITSGVISIDRLPSAVVERMYVAATESDLANLTTEQVQNGDTVKVAATGAMYFVVDQSKLGTADYMDGLSQYTAGIASQVDWSGVVGKPTTIAGYGITDAVNSSEKVAVAGAENAGKILTIGADGKLAASITGDAATLGGNAPEFYAKQSDMTTAQGGIKANADEIAAIKASLNNETTGVVAKVTALEGDMTTAKTDITNLKSGEAITALAASKITGTLTRAQLPADISGRLFTKADLAEAQTSLTAANASVGDLVKLADGKVYVVTDTANLDNAAGYTLIVDVAGATIKWSQLADVPTSLAAMNWADAVTTSMLVDTASAANAGKLLKINAAGKMDASITGDAATVGGHAPAYFATKDEHDAVAARVVTAEGDIDQLQADIKAIDAGWITTGTISIDRLPHGALERCVVVATDEARFVLTSNDVQKGDTVKVTDTGLMYFVVDDTKLGEAAGYEVYTAGTASAVDWSGITSKPTTLTGYGITDAVAASEKVTVASSANVGKILVLNADGKLDVDITGSVEWAKILNGPASSVNAIDAAVEAATHTNRAVLDKLAVDGDGYLTYDGAALAYKSELDEVALGALKVVDDASAVAATEGQLVLESI